MIRELSSQTTWEFQIWCSKYLNTCMKNFWIQLYRKKRASFWTVEFARSGSFLLQPRRAGCETPNPNEASVTFYDSMFNQSDKELLDFLGEVHHHGMKNIYSRFRHYRSLTDPKEYENFEFTGLDYVSIGQGKTVDDIKFDFTFRHIRHYVLKS